MNVIYWFKNRIKHKLHELHELKENIKELEGRDYWRKKIRDSIKIIGDFIVSDISWDIRFKYPFDASEYLNIFYEFCEDKKLKIDDISVTMSHGVNVIRVIYVIKTTKRKNSES